MSSTNFLVASPFECSVWCLQSDTEGEWFQVIAPYFGWFHPKDAPELVERFAVDQTSFQFFDRGISQWVTLSPSSGTQWVSGLDELHYRSLGVEDAPGMPITRGTKRNADGASLSEYAGQSIHRCVIQPSWSGYIGLIHFQSFSGIESEIEPAMHTDLCLTMRRGRWRQTDRK